VDNPENSRENGIRTLSLAACAEQVANATLQIICGPSRGSGFHFLNPEIVVTNYHVVKSAPGAAQAHTEDGVELDLQLVDQSPADEYDFAIYKIEGGVPKGRIALQPSSDDHDIERGREIMFGGFPHGIEELLVQRAIVSGPYGEVGVYIDGAVNGGNSGGPIVDLHSAELVGIATSSRFMYGEPLDEMAAQAQQLANYARSMAGPDPNQSGVSMQIGIGGIDFFGLMAASRIQTC
jgi:S1-C subfamily serine protease